MSVGDKMKPQNHQRQDEREEKEPFPRVTSADTPTTSSQSWLSSPLSLKCGPQDGNQEWEPEDGDKEVVKPADARRGG